MSPWRAALETRRFIHCGFANLLLQFHVAITDNGRGMSPETLKHAATFARSPSKRGAVPVEEKGNVGTRFTDGQISRFGEGIKHAFARLSTRHDAASDERGGALLFISKEAGSPLVHEAILDWVRDLDAGSLQQFSTSVGFFFCLVLNETLYSVTVCAQELIDEAQLSISHPLQQVLPSKNKWTGAMRSRAPGAYDKSFLSVYGYDSLKHTVEREPGGLDKHFTTVMLLDVEPEFSDLFKTDCDCVATVLSEW